MHQRKYALELISELGLSCAKPVGCPMEPNMMLTTSEFANHVVLFDDVLLTDPGPYQRLLGKLLYLTITRPDISFAVQSLSQFMHSPKVLHMEVALKMVGYIKTSPGLGVFLGAKCSESLSAYYDVDWAACPIHASQSLVILSSLVVLSFLGSRRNRLPYLGVQLRLNIATLLLLLLKFYGYLAYSKNWELSTSLLYQFIVITN